MVAAVLAVLALASACVEADRGKDRDRSAQAAERAHSSGAATSPRIPSGTDLPGSSVAVDFARDGSGFALLAECGKTRCQQRVAVLDKGADAWRLERSPLADVTVEHGITATLRVLEPGRALITEGVWPPPDRTWFTSDGGRHWRQGSAEPSGTVPVLPEGGTLFEDCTRMDQEGNNCEHSRVLTVLPTTGEFRALATQPPLKPPVVPAGQTEDLVFASGRDPRSGRVALAVSEDGGRSWRLSQPTVTGESVWDLRVTGVGKVLYAAEPGELPDEENVKNGLLALYRSTDGGGTWERVWEHRKGVDPRSLLGTPVAAADGSLTIHSEDGVWRSTDGGRSFARHRNSGGMSGWATTTALGYLWGDSFGVGSWRLSTDGVQWTRFELGNGT
ncbi:WD40/YVTN/BNR-like repeat-containing protein [Streptomyces sp. NPDC006365]|uniref:WD40/YVTN/BNR-like repeat-containing protein n=1 Tax=Streptomyces sp. NPDC006365 TaxID=3364744 RepID=UPI0036C23B65